MVAIGLAAIGAVLFGALTVALRAGLARTPDIEAATVVTSFVGLAVVLPLALVGVSEEDLGGELWPFLAAGLLAPGAAQILFVAAVRSVGAARSATLITAAPLLSAAPAFLLLDEPFHAALVVGAVLVVAGAVVLTAERLAGTDLRRIGFALALGAASLISARDNFVRWAATGNDVSGRAAAVASLAAASVFLTCYLAALRRRETPRALRRALVPFLPAGALLGLAYSANMEALDRGRVTVVTPLYATEALWAVLFAALFLGAGKERIGARLLLAVALTASGAALIGAAR